MFSLWLVVHGDSNYCTSNGRFGHFAVDREFEFIESPEQVLETSLDPWGALLTPWGVRRSDELLWACVRPDWCQTLPKPLIIIISSNDHLEALVALPDFHPEMNTNAIQTHPSSRAGGQHYGSFNKLPRTTITPFLRIPKFPNGNYCISSPTRSQKLLM